MKTKPAIHRRAEALRSSIDRHTGGPVVLATTSRRAAQRLLRASPLLTRRLAAVVVA